MQNGQIPAPSGPAGLCLCVGNSSAVISTVEGPPIPRVMHEELNRANRAGRACRRYPGMALTTAAACRQVIPSAVTSRSADRRTRGSREVGNPESPPLNLWPKGALRTKRRRASRMPMPAQCSSLESGANLDMSGLDHLMSVLYTHADQTDPPSDGLGKPRIRACVQTCAQTPIMSGTRMYR